MNLRVQVRSNGREGKVLRVEDFPIDPENPLTFGRAEGQNRLHVPDDKKMVSSKHGRIELRAGACYVVDLGSTNGTRLDGQPVAGEGSPLGDGCVIGVGPYELQVFVLVPNAPPLAADATLHSFDPGRLASDLDDALAACWLGACRAGADERAAQLAEAARERLRRLPPAQARAVLQRLLARHGAAPAGPAGGEDEALQAGYDRVRALARSLVPEQPLTGARDVNAFAKLVDQFCELSLRWITHSLQARTEFENQFGAEVTMVFQRSNNPLKGLDHTELGRRLFDWTSLDASAIRAQLDGIFRDLSEHQLGLLLGVKEAIRAVTERLSPDAIESLAQKDAGWLTSRGAKAWDVYRSIYRDLLEEKSKLFHEVISPAIRQGYLSSHQDDAGPRP